MQKKKEGSVFSYFRSDADFLCTFADWIEVLGIVVIFLALIIDKLSLVFSPYNGIILQ